MCVLFKLMIQKIPIYKKVFDRLFFRFFRILIFF